MRFTQFTIAAVSCILGLTIAIPLPKDVEAQAVDARDETVETTGCITSSKTATTESTGSVVCAF
ncbi:unnamed protein product [Clonostachys rhizophaga]|uniref:Uncharacterized protein n=1 Tax=Clonostachys rhizophaga TaxID=160324 RepID=A0A9N9VIY1_9HYPO|nr:unnamed protein product [Clonostachys rhizophaga]